jgi:hypothetical protein
MVLLVLQVLLTLVLVEVVRDMPTTTQALNTVVQAVQVLLLLDTQYKGE